jgi:hypothetical protein
MYNLHVPKTSHSKYQKGVYWILIQRHASNKGGGSSIELFWCNTALSEMTAYAFIFIFVLERSILREL